MCAAKVHHNEKMTSQDDSMTSQPMEGSTEELYAKKRRQEENDFTARLLKPYSTFIVKYPGIMISIVLLILALSIVLSIVKSTGAKDLPDFSNPVKGYQAKGTLLSARNISYYNLREDYKRLKTLKRKKRNTVSNTPAWRNPRFILHTKSAWQMFYLFHKSISNGNMFTQRKLSDVCQWYIDTIQTETYYSRYVKDIYSVHSIPRYILLMNGKTSCRNITQANINDFITLITDCAGYYKNGTLAACMSDTGMPYCDTISLRCKYHNILRHPQDMATMLYNVYHFLGDLKLQDNPSYLTSAATITILEYRGQRMKEFIRPLYEKKLIDLDDTKYGEVEVSAYEMWGLKFDIFKVDMIVQASLLGIAIAIIILLTWFFSGSFFLGLMTLGCILIAMIIGYFVYSRIFDLHFFPFLNLTCFIFIIGIGADDIYVYTGIWNEAKYIYKMPTATCQGKEHIEYMIKWTTHTLRHAVVAMLVTSLTTTAAFFSNMTSDVTSVKCFGLFTGTAIIILYMLMVTFFPACVVIHDKYFTKCMNFCCPCCCRKFAIPQYNNNEENIEIRAVQTCDNLLTQMSKALFHKILPKFIIRFRYIFVAVLFLLGVGGVIVTFGEPGLNPPVTDKFQFFASSHSLEQYDLVVKKQFAFGLGSNNLEHQVNFVFGVQPVDDGDRLDPDDAGSLIYRKDFDVSSQQLWLRQFCRNLKNAPFYKSSSHCNNVEKMMNTFEKPCTGNNKCCNQILPLKNSSLFNECFKQKSGVSTLVVKNGVVRAFIIRVQTTFTWSFNYHNSKKVVDNVNAWTGNQMSNVSDAWKGWWRGNLLFYDLQNSLFDGTKFSLGIAVGVAFAVILATSVNILLSVYSILTILFIISTTVGTLILDGWQLNILESTVLSVAAGLSADFTLHYSVAYKASLNKKTRSERVEYAVLHIGPAVFMGAITTFIAGLVMLPSTILSYQQFGTFLMVVMFYSWLYSTFFFLPLCAIIGPKGYYGQLTCGKQMEGEEQEEVDMAQVTKNRNACVDTVD